MSKHRSAAPKKRSKPVRRAIVSAGETESDGSIARRRDMLADLCRQIGQRVAPAKSTKKHAPDALVSSLPPRQLQTLEGLLAGDGEKQIAHRLKLSRNTVHVYVKSLYRRFGVNSRGELLALFVTPPAHWKSPRLFVNPPSDFGKTPDSPK